MASRNATATAGPANVNFKTVQGGFVHSWDEWLQDINLTGATVTMQLRLTDDMSATPRTLTTAAASWNGTGGGLTVTTGGNAPATPARTGSADSKIAINIPSDYAAAASSAAVYYLLSVLASGVTTAYKTGNIEYTWRVER
jgi:hypothetical protein